RSREAWVLGWLRRLDGRSQIQRILDVGCGDGLLFDRLREFGHVEGIEPDASVVSGRHASRIQVAPLDERFAVERPFDVVLMLDVLEHIRNDELALRVAARAVRPGGRLLLTVPALPWLWSQHDVVCAHYRRYTRQSLRDLLQCAGFIVEELRYFFFW